MNWDDYTLLALVRVLGLSGVISLGVALWSLRWPSVKGRIEASFLDQETGWDTTVRGSDLIVYKRETESHALAYSYEIGGVKYLGANIKPWGNHEWSLRTGSNEEPDSGKILWSGARDTAKGYRPDAGVDVYYCPVRPQWSCLEPGGLVIPLFLTGVALVLYLTLVRS
ncbi:MAG: hypothetical protein JNG83_12565 [Opitutaceae bacterium]|nr:hypothetical protein [Opitutaceae bacterium]